MATVSYGLKITEAYHIFDKTIKIYRNIVHYISHIAIRHYPESPRYQCQPPQNAIHTALKAIQT